jgi:membrane-associated phospholipid phosphatase|tara:strand:- start:745 stop:1629 length:885 start_codon:yes stop_codon:yes gene_type:complete
MGKDTFDLSKVNPVRAVDYRLSQAIYDLFNQKNMKLIPNYLGLIPYEVYVLPGMYLAILQVIWLGTPNPVQFHLLPHFFAYSMFQLLKGSIKTPRPGCHIKGMKGYIDEGHCSHGHEWQSFPSGHSGIATSLAVALFMEMMYSDDSHFFEINITDIKTKRLIAFSGIFVASMVILHRVSKGYHSLFDSLTGMLIGGCIGFISWTALEFFKKKYHAVCEKMGPDAKECDLSKFEKENDEISYWLSQYNVFKLKNYDDPLINSLAGISRIVFTIPILYLVFKFVTKDVFKLASIKH